MPRCPSAPPPAIYGMEMALEFSRRVVTYMCSKVGSWSIFGRMGLVNPLMISSTVRAFLGAMLLLFYVYEGLWLLGSKNGKG
jgi:hypothetical protein